MQAVRTNVLGTENVLEAAVNAGVKRGYNYRLPNLNAALG